MKLSVHIYGNLSHKQRGRRTFFPRLHLESIIRNVIDPKGFYSEGSLFRKVLPHRIIIPKIFYPEGSLFRNRGFARRATHLYAHDFAPLLGFLYVQKQKQNALLFWNHFITEFPISPERVC